MDKRVSRGQSGAKMKEGKPDFNNRISKRTTRVLKGMKFAGNGQVIPLSLTGDLPKRKRRENAAAREKLEVLTF